MKEEVCDWEVRGGGSSEWIRSWERAEKEGLVGMREECRGERRWEADEDGIVEGKGDCSAHALQGTHKQATYTTYSSVQLKNTSTMATTSTICSAHSVTVEVSSCLYPWPHIPRHVY